ncbi:MAG: large conductance mechanosensitive channel protein MscL [Hyphomonas sp.]
MLKEFKEFALKGNLVDLAVGFILGGAFATVVASLVNDVMMPVLGRATGGVDFSNLFLNISESPASTTSLAAAREAGDAVIAYGLFINNVISFTIMAFALFFVVKAMNNLKKKEEAAPPPPPPRQEVLLEEIRNLLARQG